MTKPEPILVHTEGALIKAKLLGRGAMLADVLMEIQNAEHLVHSHHQLYFPDKKFLDKSDEYRDAFMDGLVWVRRRLLNEHSSATKEATKMIRKANAQAYTLAQIANVLIEIAQEQEMEKLV